VTQQPTITPHCPGGRCGLTYWHARTATATSVGFRAHRSHRAIGTCVIAAAVIVPSLLGSLGGWPAIVAGILTLIAALVALWVIQRRRARTLW
jgi:hypothetical protein